MPYFAYMYEKTHGIVLHTIPYNDTLSVVHIYTQLYGRMSYTLPRGSGRTAKMARALYMPLSLLEIEIEVRPRREMQRISEAHTWMPLPHIQSDPVRASLAMFLSEFLSSILQNGEANPQLFSYIAQSVQLLDRIDAGYANFHLCFLVGLTSFLGITPNSDNYRPGKYFNMQEGIFVSQQPLSTPYLRPSEAHFLTKLLRMDYTNMHLFRFSRGERGAILNHMLAYYKLHIPGMKALSSPAILQALFD